MPVSIFFGANIKYNKQLIEIEIIKIKRLLFFESCIRVLRVVKIFFIKLKTPKIPNTEITNKKIIKILLARVNKIFVIKLSFLKIREGIRSIRFEKDEKFNTAIKVKIILKEYDELSFLDPFIFKVEKYILLLI